MNISSTKINVYCIPGLGTNPVLFKYLDLPDFNIIFVQWLSPLKKETLPEYAMRLAKQIDTSRPFALLGVSFGGMCAIEIAKQLHPLKTILISSCKTCKELHPLLKPLKFFPIHFLIPEPWYILLARLAKRRFGVTKEMKKDFFAMMTRPPENYFVRTVNMVSHWENKEIPERVIHIHGNADKIIPFRERIMYDYVLDKGSHLMILDRAEEISEFIRTKCLA